MITHIIVGLTIGTLWALVWIHLYDIRKTKERIKWMREQNDLIDLIRENNAFDRMTRQMARHRVTFPVCSPARFKETAKAYKDWSEKSAQAWYRRAENCLEETDFHKSITTGRSKEIT